jgi:hypothetical protein
MTPGAVPAKSAKPYSIAASMSGIAVKFFVDPGECPPPSLARRTYHESSRPGRVPEAIAGHRPGLPRVAPSRYTPRGVRAAG